MLEINYYKIEKEKSMEIKKIFELLYEGISSFMKWKTSNTEKDTKIEIINNNYENFSKNECEQKKWENKLEVLKKYFVEYNSKCEDYVKIDIKDENKQKEMIDSIKTLNSQLQMELATYNFEGKQDEKRRIMNCIDKVCNEMEHYFINEQCIEKNKSIINCCIRCRMKNSYCELYKDNNISFDQCNNIKTLALKEQRNCERKKDETLSDVKKLKEELIEFLEKISK